MLASAHIDKMPMNSNPQNSRVVVVSIGRSGTSLIARILHEVLGVDFGAESDHIPRNFNNPDGYFENATFLAFNDRVLQAANGWVLSPPPINYIDLLPKATRAELIAEAKSLLDQYAADKPSFGWKDPRLSFTLPIWRAACREITPIIAFRKPISVLSSIAAQLERPVESLTTLWFEYYQRVFAYTANMPCHTVSFDDLLADPTPVVMGMARHLGVTADEFAVRTKLAGIVKPQQSRHSSAENAPNGTSLLDFQTNTLYACLRDSVKNGGQPDREHVMRLLQK
jgi:hypothetical protein